MQEFKWSVRLGIQMVHVGIQAGHLGIQAVPPFGNSNHGAFSNAGRSFWSSNGASIQELKQGT